MRAPPQPSVAKPPLAKEIKDFVFKGTPINAELVRELAGGAFLEHQRKVVLIGGPRVRQEPPSHRHCITRSTEFEVAGRHCCANPARRPAHGGRPVNSAALACYIADRANVLAGPALAGREALYGPSLAPKASSPMRYPRRELPLLDLLGQPGLFVAREVKHFLQNQEPVPVINAARQRLGGSGRRTRL